jgi:aldose 1-epimerase
LDTHPSGHQVEITYNDQRATVVEVGDGICCYEVSGRSVLDPYPIDSMCDGAHGAPLIPWPNRSSPGLTAWPTGYTASTGSSTKWHSPSARNTMQPTVFSAGERGRSCAPRPPE